MFNILNVQDSISKTLQEASKQGHSQGEEMHMQLDPKSSEIELPKSNGIRSRPNPQE